MVEELIEDMKARSWKPAAGSIDGGAYDPADAGAFGKEVHKRVAARFQGKPGWLAELYVDNVTLKIYDQPLPPGQRGRTNLDLVKLKDGYIPIIGEILDRGKIEGIYEIKTSLSGGIGEDQLERLKSVKGGDIKVVNSKFRWTASRGWHISAKFSRFLRILGIAGLAAAPIAFVSGSEGEEKLLIFPPKN